MSIDPSTYDAAKPNGKRVPCMDTCALYWKGFCSINILAQKAINDFEKEKKNKLSE